MAIALRKIRTKAGRLTFRFWDTKTGKLRKAPRDKPRQVNKKDWETYKRVKRVKKARKEIGYVPFTKTDKRLVKRGKKAAAKEVVPTFTKSDARKRRFLTGAKGNVKTTLRWFIKLYDYSELKVEDGKEYPLLWGHVGYMAVDGEVAFNKMLDKHFTRKGKLHFNNRPIGVNEQLTAAQEAALSLRKVHKQTRDLLRAGWVPGSQAEYTYNVFITTPLRSGKPGTVQARLKRKRVTFY